MELIKSIKFRYHTGYFHGPGLDEILIKITKTSVTYQQIHTDCLSKKRGNLWKSKTDPKLWSRLTMLSYGFSKDLECMVLDGPGVSVTITYFDSSKKEYYLMRSLSRCGLKEISKILKQMLKGLEVPNFLIGEEDIEDDYFDDDDTYEPL